MTLEFEQRILDRALAELPARIVEKESRPSGGMRIEGLAYSLDWLAGWMLGLGTAVRVLEPQGLRERMAESARELAAHHEKSPLEHTS